MITAKRFEQLFDEYVDEVSAFLYTYSSNHAQLKDWIQEIFIKLWEVRGKIDFTHSGFKSYLFTTARNHALKKIQKEKRYKEWLDQNLVRLTELHIDDRAANDPKIVKIYNKALSKIPPRSQKAYILSRNDGLTYKEIAGVMDISIKTVEAHISKALQILRSELKDYSQQ